MIPRVTCIVLNWNGWRDTIACLRALEKTDFPAMETVVVDNGSTDDSVEQIRSLLPAQRVVETGINLGFAGGNNVAIRMALDSGADYVWLLNNDTEPAPDALAALVAKAESDNKIGAVSSVCYYADRPETVQIWAGGRANLWIGYSPSTTAPHDDSWFHWLNGTSLLIRVTTLRTLGLLDEGFFLYMEDVEFGIRLRKNGWKLAAAPASVVLHKVNASTGGNRRILDRFATASGLRFLRLHSPAPWLAIPAFLAIRIARRLVRLRFALCLSVWEGTVDYFRSPGRKKSGALNEGGILS